MRLRPITDSRSPEYQFMEQLLVASFPREEYRDLPEIRRLTDAGAPFCPTLIQEDGGQELGLVNFWHLEGVTYIEHLAVLERLRNRGIGARALGLLQETEPQGLILEAELPHGEMARRRIGFYLRCGFHILEGQYFQPPYRKGDDRIPMHILYCGARASALGMDHIRTLLLRDIYHAPE